jgi:hypothetical protein
LFWRAACSQLVRLHRSLRALRRVVAGGRLKDTSKIERRLGRLEERYPQAWSMLSEVEHRSGSLLWSWNKARLRGAKLRQGAYLLRTNLDPMDPDAFGVNTFSLQNLKQPSGPSKANWPSVRFGIASSAASWPIS